MDSLLSPRPKGFHTPKPSDPSEHSVYALQENYLGKKRTSSHDNRWFLLHLFIGVMMILATLTPFMYNLPVYSTSFQPRISQWWNVDPDIKDSGHNEMVVPTYFFLYMVIPTTIAALLEGWSHYKTINRFSTPFFHRTIKILHLRLSYGELIFLAVIFIGNALVFHFQLKKRYKTTNTTTDTIKNIGTSLGFTGLFNMTFLALPATRHSFWMQWLDITFAHGMKYHQWLAIAATLALSIHATVLLVYYIRLDSLMSIMPCLDCDLAKQGKENYEHFFGILALLCLLLMGFTAQARRYSYPLFRMVHYLYIPASLFVVLHSRSNLYFLYTSMVIFLVNRMYSASSITNPVTITKAAALTCDVVELRLHCTSSYRGGDTVWIKVPALSKTQWHPFSIASTPLHNPSHLTIYVKCLGPWTTGLYHYVNECQVRNLTPIVYMDGDYSTTPLIPESHYDVVFVGGGIGITKFMGQLKHVLLSQPQQRVWLIWHVRQSEMLIQFQNWLYDIEAIANRNQTYLKIQLHVTQDPLSSFNRSSKYSGLLPDFRVHLPDIERKPYAHISMKKRLILLLLSFGFSSGALAFVSYGGIIEGSYSKHWILQRILQYLIVIVGCGMAYLATLYVPEAPLTTSGASERSQSPISSCVLFLNHFNVQSTRVEWHDYFNSIKLNCPSKSTVGVYVSGPKPLLDEVHEILQNDQDIFHVKVQSFSM